MKIVESCEEYEVISDFERKCIKCLDNKIPNDEGNHCGTFSGFGDNSIRCALFSS